PHLPIRRDSTLHLRAAQCSKMLAVVFQCFAHQARHVHFAKDAMFAAPNLRLSTRANTCTFGCGETRTRRASTKYRWRQMPLPTRTARGPNIPKTDFLRAAFARGDTATHPLHNATNVPMPRPWTIRHLLPRASRACESLAAAVSARPHFHFPESRHPLALNFKFAFGNEFFYRVADTFIQRRLFVFAQPFFPHAIRAHVGGFRAFLFPTHIILHIRDERAIKRVAEMPHR